MSLHCLPCKENASWTIYMYKEQIDGWLIKKIRDLHESTLLIL